MSISVETKPRRLRIVSQPVAELEVTLNGLLDDYVATVWSFQEVAGEVVGTVVLVHMSEIRKQQFAAQPVMVRRQ